MVERKKIAIASAWTFAIVTCGTYAFVLVLHFLSFFLYVDISERLYRTLLLPETLLREASGSIILDMDGPISCLCWGLLAGAVAIVVGVLWQWRKRERIRTEPKN